MIPSALRRETFGIQYGDRAPIGYPLTLTSVKKLRKTVKKAASVEFGSSLSLVAKLSSVSHSNKLFSCLEMTCDLDMATAVPWKLLSELEGISMMKGCWGR